MNKIKLIFALILTVGFQLTARAQADDSYPPDGIYTSFSSFRNGLPDITKDKLLRGTAGSGDFSIRQWINTENLYYTGTDGEKQTFERKKFWGYVENGTLYLYLGYKFHKVSMLGQITYFLESYPIIRGNVAPVVTDARATSAYRLMDMETGELFDYTPSNLEDLLAPDENLYNEFKAIESPKIQRRKMYSFMERFNKAHPLRPLEK